MNVSVSWGIQHDRERIAWLRRQIEEVGASQHRDVLEAELAHMLGLRPSSPRLDLRPSYGKIAVLIMVSKLLADYHLKSDQTGMAVLSQDVYDAIGHITGIAPVYEDPEQRLGGGNGGAGAEIQARDHDVASEKDGLESSSGGGL